MVPTGDEIYDQNRKLLKAKREAQAASAKLLELETKIRGANAEKASLQRILLQKVSDMESVKSNASQLLAEDRVQNRQGEHVTALVNDTISHMRNVVDNSKNAQIGATRVYAAADRLRNDVELAAKLRSTTA